MSIPLLPVLAFAIMAHVLVGAFGAILESLSAFMQSFFVAAVWIADAIWVLLVCDWGQIVWLIPAWIGWLLS